MSADQVGDDVSDTTTSGTAGNGDTRKENDNVDAGAGGSSQGPLDISIVGSPAPGITADFETMLTLGSADGAHVQGEDSSQAAGSDTGDVKFSAMTMGTEGGKVNDTVTETINTDDGHGNTVKSSDSIVDKVTVGDMGVNTDEGEDDFSDGNPQAASDNEFDTDVITAVADTNDKRTGQAQSTTTTVDPTTGLQTTVQTTDNATDNENKDQSDVTFDKHTASGVGSGAVSADDVTFDDVANGGGNAADNPTAIISIVGNDAPGETVSFRETINLNANATDQVSDEDKGEVNPAGGGGDTETAHVDVTGHAGITDTIVGTVVTVDPNTGITRTVSDNITATGTDDEHDHGDETDVRAGGTDSDTADQTDTSNLTVSSNGTETVTQTNPDGTLAGPTTTTTNSANDAIHASVALARAATGGGSATQSSSTTTPSGTETGSRTSSNPAVGSASWSNLSLDQATLNQLAANSAPPSNVSTHSNGGTDSNSDPPITTGGPVTSTITGLHVPGLPAEKIGAFLDMLKVAKGLEDQIIALIAEREIALRYAGYALYPSPRGVPINREALLAKADAIAQQLSDLQQQLNGLAKQYYDAGFADLEVTGIPQGLSDNAVRGPGITGVGLGAAIAAYRQSLTSISGRDGLIPTDGPLEFVVTLGAGKLLKLGIGAAVASAAGRAGKQARLRALLSDPNVSSADRGWIQQELNSIARGQRPNIRLPGSSRVRQLGGRTYGGPGGKVLAHRRGLEARKGFDYSNADLQDIELHMLQHRYEGYK
jgi:hypothetical protein